MATIGITNSSRSSLMGIEFLTRRLNVVPNSEEKAEKTLLSAEKERKSESLEEKSRERHLPEDLAPPELQPKSP